MKKLIPAIAAVLILMMTAVSCGAVGRLEDSSFDEDKINTSQAFTARTEKETYSPDEVKINVIFSNSSAKEAAIGRVFTAQRKTDGVWKTIPFAEGRDMFTDDAMLIPPNGEASMIYDLSRLDYTLKEGDYRIVIEVGITEAGTVAAEFAVA